MIEADTKPNARIPSPSIAPADLAIDRVHLARMTLGDKHLAAVGAYAHTLKGSARGIGTWRVAEAAEAVECAACVTGAADLADAIDRLAAAIAEAQAAIAELAGAS
jgi:hypothetical protein